MLFMFLISRGRGFKLYHDQAEGGQGVNEEGTGAKLVVGLRLNETMESLSSDNVVKSSSWCFSRRGGAEWRVADGGGAEKINAWPWACGDLPKFSSCRVIFEKPLVCVAH